MAEKASEAGAPPQPPLTEKEIDELADSLAPYAREESALMWDRLVAEVRRLRARVKELEERHDASRAALLAEIARNG